MKKGNSLSDDFWSRVLGPAGLESPGYHEAVKDAQEISRAKKEAKADKKKK